MGVKFSIITFMLFISTNAFGKCHIKVPSHLIVASSATLKEIAAGFVFENCEAIKQQKFLSHVVDFSGDLKPRAIELAFKAEISQPLKIVRLEDYLKSRLIKDDSFHIHDAKIIGQNNHHLSYKEFDEIFLQCKQCDTLGEHNAKLTHTNQKGIKSLYWISFKKVKKIKVLSSLISQSVNHQELNAKNFEWKFFLTDAPEQYFTDLSQLSFYKANIKLKEGDPLKKNQITPLFLIRSGDIATIKMKNKNIELKGKGIAIRAGKIGDIISLKNIRTKKIIMGKVIGKNTIEAQL